MANKKKRKPKTSQGVHGGGGKVRLTELEKILLGKGALARIKPAETKKKAA